MNEQITIDLGIEEILDQAHAEAKEKEQKKLFFKKIGDAKTILANYTNHTEGQFGWAIFMLINCLEGIGVVMEFFMANPASWLLDGRMYEAVYSSALKAGDEGVAFLKSESGRLIDDFRSVMGNENPHRDRRLDYKIVQFVTLCEVTNNITGLVRMLAILNGAVKGLPPLVWDKYKAQIRQVEQKNAPVGADRPFQKERRVTESPWRIGQGAISFMPNMCNSTLQCFFTVMSSVF